MPNKVVITIVDDIDGLECSIDFNATPRLVEGQQTSPCQTILLDFISFMETTGTILPGQQPDEILTGEESEAANG